MRQSQALPIALTPLPNDSDVLHVSAEGQAPVQFEHALLPLTVSEQITMQYVADADPTVSPQAPSPGPV